VERLDLHGILVGVASRIILRGYREFYGWIAKFQPNVSERLLSFDAEPPWEENIELGLRPYAEKVRMEMSRRTFDRGVLAERLSRFGQSRSAILALAGPVLDELSGAAEFLEALDYPFSLEKLGINVEMCLLPLRNVRLLRSRYSTFDLAYELGMEKELYSLIERTVKSG
jgi:hypothetical protein